MSENEGAITQQQKGNQFMTTQNCTQICEVSHILTIIICDK